MKNKELYIRTLRLALPMMIQNGITNAVGLIDNIMVGSLGNESITAVSIAGQLIFVFSLAIFGGISGPGIYGAQFYGKGSDEGVRNTFRLKIWISLTALAVGVAMFLLLDEQLIGLYLHGESADIDPILTTSLGCEYLGIMVIGLVPFVITQIYSSTLRETGESVKPMIAGICSVVADITLNYLLIYGNFGFPKLGVAGAAIATVISRFVEMTVIVLWTHLRRKKHGFINGVYRTLLIPKTLAGKMIRKGLPIFLNEFLWAGGVAALTQCYSMRGLDIIPGINISNALCNLLSVVFVALGNSVGIVIGQLLGAKEYEKAKKGSFGLMRFSAYISACLTLILISVSGVFPLLYDTTDEIRHYSTLFIIITACAFPIQGFINSLYFTVRSGGRTFITFLFDSVFSWVVSVPAAFVLCSFTALDIFVVYAIIQGLDLIKIAIGSALVKKGVWISNIVEENALPDQSFTFE